MIARSGGASSQTGHLLASAGLMHGPTPLEYWPRLSQLTGSQIYAKRDDLSRIGLGGNKIRKLDLILGQALLDGVDVVITVGGAQSNHCRQTAAACARLGLRCVLYLQGQSDGKALGNVMLDLLFGAEVHFVDAASFDEVDLCAKQRAEEFRADGLRPLFVPLGGGTALGTWSFAVAAEELSDQCLELEISPKAVVLAVGTGSTVAGLSMGPASGPEAELVGVSVSRPRAVLEVDVARCRAEAAHLKSGISLDARAEPRLTLRDDYIGLGYTRPTEAGIHAVRTLARTEGVLTDLTYSGKSLACLLDLAKDSGTTDALVFWHTGGFPELFARDSELLEG